MLQALKPVADAVDPGGVTILAEMFGRAGAGQGEGLGSISGKDATAVGSGDGGGHGGRGGGAEKNGREEPLLPSVPAPTLEAQSALVDLGRTALKVYMKALLIFLVVTSIFCCCWCW